jgi:hypothetical protein
MRVAAKRSSQWARARADVWGRIWFAVVAVGTVANVALVASLTPNTGRSQLAVFLAGELVVFWASLFAMSTRDMLLSNARVQDDLERTERLINARAGSPRPDSSLRAS